MKNRFSLSPRLALRKSWLLNGLGLAILIVGGTYMLDEQQLANVELTWPKEEVRLGNSFPISIKLSGLAIDDSEITDFYLHLPEDLEASFLPASLKIIQGSLGQATVLPYSGKKRLIIEDISVDSLQLEVMVQVSEDIAFAERSFPFAYGVKINQQVEAAQTEKDLFTIKYVPLQLKHRLLRAPDASHPWARYEVLLHNPAQGPNYEKENGLITLNASTNHPEAIIKSLNINGQNRPLPDGSSNQLDLKGLKLPAGTSLLLHYEVAFPEGVPDSSLANTATAYVPASIIKKTSLSSIDPTPSIWEGLKLQTNQNGLQLSWQTLLATTNKGFQIEGSLDGIHFDTLDFVPQEGLTLSHQQYQLSNQKAEYNYFRLGLAGLDGSMQYSKILSHHALNNRAYLINFIEIDQLAEIQVAIPQQLRIEIRNQLGVTLAVVFDGMLEAGILYSLDLSMSEFSEGDYLFWMEGEYFKSRRWFIRRRGKWRRFG